MTSGWLARADLLASENRTREAIGALTRALRADGPSAEVYLRRGRLHHRNGRYRLALRDLDRAVGLSGDAEPLLERAVLLSLEGRFAQARRDANRVVALRPDYERARLFLVRLLIRAGSLEPASRAISTLLKTGSPDARGEALFCRGLLALKRGRAGAAADFRRLLSDGSADGNLAQRARFYWIASKAAQGASPPAKARLFFCGLGLFPPYTATLEVLRALPHCDVIVNNISEIETRELLDVLGRGIRCVTYRDGGNDRFVLRGVFRELNRGKKVAFVTRGHAMVFGTLGRMLVERCRKTSTPFQIYGAVSSLDVLLDRAGAALALPARAVSAFDCSSVSKAPALDAAAPLIVSFNRQTLRRPGVKRLQAALSRSYPRGHACWMFGPRYDAEPRTIALDQLSQAYPEIDTSLMLYIPARAGAAR